MRLSIFLILFSLYLSESIYAQRTVDLALTCISPAGEVNHDSMLPLRFTATNKGPDSLVTGDTIFYYLSFRYPDGKVDFAYFGGFGINGTMYIDGTATYNFAYGIGFLHPQPERQEPAKVDFCVGITDSYEDENGNIYQLSYSDTIAVNDTCCKEVIILPNSSGGGTSIINAGINDAYFFCYPNPAKNTVKAYFNANMLPQTAQITLSDIGGKQLLQQTFSKSDLMNGAVNLDVSILPEGIYLLSLITENNQYFQKFTIQR